ncbi:hypothetical protein EYC80_002024 [Monilinia laxa]|uniref:Uncharacterized protein n=1 Tax=Monilinia laxa TaxID=61186 RepID=A0A5N6K6T5_MONLA|nr:hypothetical protein EYC80_002024 [Monilinia laxa]
MDGDGGAEGKTREDKRRENKGMNGRKRREKNIFTCFPHDWDTHLLTGCRYQIPNTKYLMPIPKHTYR